MSRGYTKLLAFDHSSSCYCSNYSLFIYIITTGVLLKNKNVHDDNKKNSKGGRFQKVARIEENVSYTEEDSNDFEILADLQPSETTTM